MKIISCCHGHLLEELESLNQESTQLFRMVTFRYHCVPKEFLDIYQVAQGSWLTPVAVVLLSTWRPPIAKSLKSMWMWPFLEDLEFIQVSYMVA